MKGTFFDNLDIELYLTQEEFNTIYLPKLELESNKLKSIYESIECELKNMDGSDSGRKVHLQGSDFDDMSDGIVVEYKKGTYFVKINRRASEFIDLRGEFGTRYGAGEKIDIKLLNRF